MRTVARLVARAVARTTGLAAIALVPMPKERVIRLVSLDAIEHGVELACFRNQ